MTFRTTRIDSRPRVVQSSLSMLVACVGLASLGCSGTEKPKSDRFVGQTEFESAPATAGVSSHGRGYEVNDAAGNATSTAAPKSNNTGAPARTVEETDLYRLDGDRLYYLNSYRGLMVFDVSNVDEPKLLGRSPIYGEPIEMVVRNGIASIVVSDWYGTTEDGTPFHGSIVRGVNATNPAQMQVVGEVTLGGWVRDTRVVGDVLYAVTEQYPWDSLWRGGLGLVDGNTASSNGAASVAVTSVNFTNGTITKVDRYEVPGQGGVFNVTPSSILLASNETTLNSNGYDSTTGRSVLKYLDISDPGGDIKERGSAIVNGTIQGWGADNGRWNVDFADGKTARAVACAGQYCGSGGGGLVLSIVDFSNPDEPVSKASLNIPSTAWSPTARFDTGRMYLSPSASGCYYYNTTNQSVTPVQIYDTSDSTAPRLAGSTSITGEVWLFMPSGNRLFALGNDCNVNANGYYGSSVSLNYLDVTNPVSPGLVGTAKFGQGWAWTPAANTFKAFTKSDTDGLVVLPFSGWDDTSYAYNNGLQLIEFTADSIATSGTAKSRGWVERGIFVKNRLVSLSDIALSVVDYSSHSQPKVVSELTLARNVVDVKPQGASVAELSSDFWDNDKQHSTLRILPAAQAEENVSGAALAELDIEGYNANVFHDSDFSYVVSNVQHEVACGPGTSLPAASKDGSDGGGTCVSWTQEVQVIDRTGGTAVKRGKIALPDNSGYSHYGWGWYGCYAWDWYNGGDVVQVQGNALAFRRWIPQYDATTGTYLDSKTALYVVDLSNPDQPALASLTTTEMQNGWWGNMRSNQDKLYVSHYEWLRYPSYSNNVSDPGVVHYYLDEVDLSDRAHPQFVAKINVPGVLVGFDQTDSTLIYTMDYRWMNDRVNNRFSVLKLGGNKAYWQGGYDIPGWVGSTFIQGSTAYFTVEGNTNSNNGAPTMSLVQLDLSDPSSPQALSTPQANQGWGWLLSVQGDRAFVTSGWSEQGIDVYKLRPGQAPSYEQFIRTRGWWTNSLARQDNQVFLASGYWGTQVVNLQ